MHLIRVLLPISVFIRSYFTLCLDLIMSVAASLAFFKSLMTLFISSVDFETAFPSMPRSSISLHDRDSSIDALVYFMSYSVSID